MPITDPDAVAAILGRTFTTEEEARAAELIDMVQSRIESRLGRPAEATASPITETHLLAAYPGVRAVLLDRWPITGVDAVTEDDTALEAEAWSADLAAGILTRIRGDAPNLYTGAWTTHTLDVTYTPATIAELAALAAEVVARAFVASEASAAAPTVLAGLRQLTIGRWSATAETSARSDPIAALRLTEDDLAIVDRWRDRLP